MGKLGTTGIATSLFSGSILYEGTVRSFVDVSGQGGNLTAVIIHSGLSKQCMQYIALLYGYSETVFLWYNKEEWYIEFYSPSMPIRMCGHGTLAALCVLAARKLFFNSPEASWALRGKDFIIQGRRDQEGMFYFLQQSPSIDVREWGIDEIASLFRVDPHYFLPRPLRIVSVGTPKLIAWMKDRASLWKVHPNFQEISSWCRDVGAWGIYLVTPDPCNVSHDFHARQFNPLAGISEDAVTGIAAGALGAYLVHYSLMPAVLRIEQGHIMQQPGLIVVKVKGEELWVGGRCHIDGECLRADYVDLLEHVSRKYSSDVRR